MRALPSLLLPLLVVPAAAQGDILYGVRGGNTLVSIDTATLIATDIGAIGFSSIGGLTIGNDGTLYGITTGTDELIRIDRTTGAGTSVGPAGLPITYSTGLGTDPTSGTLYGVAQGGVGFSSVLVRFDRNTGAATRIADMTGNGSTAVVGLDGDGAGQLWGIDGGSGHEELIRVDKASGAVAVVGPAGLANYPNIGCFDIGPSGTAWAVNSQSPSYTLLQVDLTTGAPIFVGVLTGIPFSTNFTGLASETCRQITASETPRAGTPPNPSAFLAGATSGPILDRTWDPSVDHRAFFPNALLDLLVLSGASANVPSPFGTLLCDLSAHLLITKPPIAPFLVPIPNNCALSGRRLCAQAGSADAAIVRLTNALDIQLGVR